jgi:hypothetical protein
MIEKIGKRRLSCLRREGCQKARLSPAGCLNIGFSRLSESVPVFRQFVNVKILIWLLDRLQKFGVLLPPEVERVEIQNVAHVENIDAENVAQSHHETRLHDFWSPYQSLLSSLFLHYAKLAWQQIRAWLVHF